MRGLNVRAGEVCRVKRREGLWVPIKPGQGRSDGDRARFHRWLFLSYPDADVTTWCDLDDVVKIVHAIGTKESVDFWMRTEHVREIA